MTIAQMINSRLRGARSNDAPKITLKDLEDLVSALEKQSPPQDLREYIDLWGVRYPAEDHGKKPPDLRDSQ